MLHPPLLCAPPLGAVLLPPQALLLSGDPVITQSLAIPMQFVYVWIDCKHMVQLPLLVLAPAARHAVHVVLASLLLLACSILAMLYCACLSRCTCFASVTLVCVPEVPVI